MKPKLHFLWFLLILLLILNGFLVFRYFSIRNEKGKQISLKKTPTSQVIKKPQLVIDNQCPGIKVELKSDEELTRFLKEAGFLSGDDKVLDTVSLVEELPEKISFVFQCAAIENQKNLARIFKVAGKSVYGYGVRESGADFKIDLLFEPGYLETLEEKDLGPNFQSILFQAALHLGKVHQLKRSLNTLEMNEVSRSLPVFLKKYDLLKVEKI